jgi:hypothetical protein
MRARNLLTDERARARAVKDATPYMQIAASFLISLLLFLAGGPWLDHKLGTEPVLLWTGSVCVLFSLGFHLWRVYLQVIQPKRRTRRH